MNKRILGLALPNIITNITVPLLGMVDMAIVGHLSSAHIGAITIGTSIFNLIYWNFGFLRMGTSGFTAQAYGAHRWDEAVKILIRACAIALAIALLLIILQWPVSWLALLIFEGSHEVLRLALVYFFIRIWAAPATLGLYAIKGWFIGMQDSKTPMWIAIFLNCVNIATSLLFVLVLHWDIAGVALGTVIANYSGLALGLFFLRKKLLHSSFIIQHYAKPSAGATCAASSKSMATSSSAPSVSRPSSLSSPPPADASVTRYSPSMPCCYSSSPSSATSWTASHTQAKAS